MEVFLVALSYVIVLALGIGIGLSIATKDMVKVMSRIEENFNNPPIVDKPVDKTVDNPEDFDYNKYLDPDGKFFTNKHIRSDDE